MRGKCLGALYTVSVALGLRWPVVDLDGGVLCVRPSLQRIKHSGLKFLKLKTQQR